ncbi:PREDICTED: probable disease resistance protein RPP1 [Camelina sativa]|uniref:Probable disease resistance protein RPP1 n=1 Tax=Camelina sativa TaxID=90675 RepID=A0ABM0TLM6_CAMSA|nr:PREDICTED: probable disease resistance protein RPP1 [Camelina sativa]
MDSISPVFLSFREEDTGRTFVSHLYRSLDQKQIQTNKDENQQTTTRDGRISPEVVKAIRESKIAVVVISENYASSVWCLDVLAEIIEFFWIFEIKTVFYEVDPGDLTRPSGKFADDFRRHEERETPETVNRWRNAMERLLEESRTTDSRFCSLDWEDDSKMLDALIANITHLLFDSIYAKEYSEESATRHSTGDRGSSDLRLMSDIYMKHIPKSLHGSGETGLGLERYAHLDTSLTEDMSNEQPSPASDDPNGLVGMYRHKKAVYGLLDLESTNLVRTVGILGTQGVGKSTLAECVLDDISCHFQHHCFLTNVNKIYQNRISPSLLKHLPGTRMSNVDIFDAIKSSLVNRKVLLVIDGVDDTDNEQFKSAVKVSRWLGPGSRVIMTSRFDHSLTLCGVKYELECLRYEEALQLFSLYAFKRTYPLIGFEPFSIRAVHFAGRLPLALRVLGSFLYDKDKESWKRTLRKLEASQDHGSCLVSNYIGTGEYLPRRQIELEQYVGADEGEYSPSYLMLL